MTVARASSTFGRTVLRRTAAQTRSRTWRQLGRRGYASAEHAKKSSDLPWMIGSVVATVPAAVWLIGQAPKKSEHHGPAHGKEEEEPAEEAQEEQQEDEKPSEDESSDDAKTEKTEDSEDESKDEKKDDSKEETEGSNDKKAESKDEGKDDSKDDAKEDSGDSNKDEHGYEKPGPNAPGQINWKPSLGKGPGEGQKVGERKPTEKKGEKDAASDYSGAKNPYLDDDEKSKKGEGLKDTMKIHGTVDPSRPARGDGKSNE